MLEKGAELMPQRGDSGLSADCTVLRDPAAAATCAGWAFQGRSASESSLPRVTPHHAPVCNTAKTRCFANSALNCSRLWAPVLGPRRCAHVVSPQEKPNHTHAAKEKEMLHVCDTAVAAGFP